MKVKIKLPAGFRYLSKNYNICSFKSKSPELDDYIHENSLKWVNDPAHLVIVLGTKKEIWGLVDLEMYAEYVLIAVLARNINARSPENIKIGSRLAHLAENLCKQLGKKEIRLEAMRDSHDWWNYRMEYRQYGQKYVDSAFGTLTPKKKLL